MKNISILGATGSIGTQALDILRNDKKNFKLVAASANKNYLKIIDIINEFNPRIIGITDKHGYEKVKDYCKENKKDIEVIFGMEGLNEVATATEADIVLTSVVGMIGLIPTINAIRAKKDIALANKETLVVGGEIVMREAAKAGVKILPVDSEHSAIFQCLQGNKNNEVSKILLTASGGPFRGKSRDEILGVSPENALNHPKWNMGKKNSIDSATLMNKGLEVIEANSLFNIPYENIQVIVHPESIIHSMVEYCDGSIISQMATTDMRLPIQYAFNFPLRGKRIVETLDFYSLGKLTFEKPDMDTFGCLKLAYEAGKIGGNVPTILNASNEVAVELFLENKITFLQIEDIIKDSLNKFQYEKNVDADMILDWDKNVRNYVENKYDL
ncbi:1-deoxy-D-xylulose-5-phosphate reductoisomerase [Clostridium akagii]|uniref:1-deoxy-D-xylulose-5-phosphate reductoisomerase n=1 Tax=Clostridium akagii TaxID=91623 RepID=UPI000478CF50|nr:1-deoxy-D-xylulose-5-phosphate reductoisomerase [Clostridium akagii]